MRLPKPAAPFERLDIRGESITISIAGKKIVIPTGNPDYLTPFNEFSGNPKLVSTSESPFGGLKGAGAPDYSVGTVSINTGDGVYLTDINGQNSTKTLTAGKLAELGNLSIDVENKTITEEFIVKNTNTSNSPTVIDSCASTTDWLVTTGTGTISTENGQLKVVGTTDATSGVLTASKTISFDFTNYPFITCNYKVTSGTVTGIVFTVMTSSGNYKTWGFPGGVGLSRFTVTNNIDTKFIFAALAPVSATGANPSATNGSTTANATKFYVAVQGTPGTSVTFYFGPIIADVGKWAAVEVDVPDSIQAPHTGGLLKVGAYSYTGTAYYIEQLLYWDYNVLNGAGAIDAIFKTTGTFLDGSKLQDIYGLNSGGYPYGKGGNLYPLGEAGQTLNYPLGSNYRDETAPAFTYSLNKGTKKRLGFSLCLPPSDNDKTNFNKVRLKLITYYDDILGNLAPDLSGNSHDGIINSGVTKVSGGGLKFNGSSGDVVIPDAGIFSFTNGTNDLPFSIFARFKMSNSVGFRVCAKTENSTNLAEWAFGTSATGYYYLQLYSDGFSGNNIQVRSTALASADVGTTITLTCTYDGTASQNGSLLYKNGSPINSTLVTTGTYAHMTNTSSVVTLGSNFRTDANKSVANGYIYEVAIYNRVLTQSEITALNNGQSITNGLLAHYKPSFQNPGSTTYEFEDSNNASYGLQNMIYPWLAIYDPSSNLIDFYLFTHQPKALEFKRDDSGNIYEATLFPGNGTIYHGQVIHCNPTLDSNSDLIPNCLDRTDIGSVSKFLQPYGFALDQYAEYDLSTSAITTNDFGITASDLDIIPFAISEGDSVSTSSNVTLPVVETVSTATGNVSIVDVRGQNTIRVRDTAYTNFGDCKVWDTVTTGQTDPNQWTRVYSTSWVFSGDTVVENGLIRIKFVVNNNLYIYGYNGSTYITISNTGTYGTFSSIQSISTDSIVVVSTVGTLTITRGQYYITTSTALKLGGTSARFLVSDTNMYDAALDSGTHLITLDNSTLYAMQITPSSTTISFLVRTSAGGFSSYINAKVATSLEPGSTATGISGAIPFDCSKLFTDASNMTGGDSV